MPGVTEEERRGQHWLWRSLGESGGEIREVGMAETLEDP